MLAFDTDIAPIVGQQVTLTSTNIAAGGPRIDLLIQRAAAPFVSKVLNGATTECDLVVQVVQQGRLMSFLYDPVAKTFVPDNRSAPVTDAVIRAMANTPGQEVTYTAATPGSGQRLVFSRLLTHDRR